MNIDTIKHNEEALVGSVLKGGLPVYQRLKDMIKPETFRTEIYQWAWSTFERLFERGLGIDTITVGDELERSGKLDGFIDGGRSGRNLLADLRMLGSPANAESYAENVQDYSVKVKLEEVGNQMVYWSKNGRRAPDIMQDVNKIMGELVIFTGKAQDHVFDLADMASKSWENASAASQGKIKTVKTGLMDLDLLLNGGMRGSDFVLVAARPGQGKTALIVTAIRNVIKGGGRVLFFSLEMSAEQLMNRLIAQEAEIDLDRIIQGKMTAEEWDRFNDAITYFSNMRDRLIVIDLPALKIGNIRQLSRREMAKQKVDLICIDYIQLANADGKNNTRQLDVGEVSRGCKALAKELDVPVFSAAQLSRAAEQRTNKKPILSDLREAGDLEQDTDIVIFIYHPEDEINSSELIVAKHRNGATGKVPVVYRAPLTKFESATVRIEDFGNR